MEGKKKLPPWLRFLQAPKVAVETNVSGATDFAPVIKYWDKKLSRRRAIAPRDLERLGLVTDGNYKWQTDRFGYFSSLFVAGQLVRLAREIPLQELRYQYLEVFGIGRGIDLGFIPKANRLGLQVSLRDISRVACENGQKIVKRHVPQNEIIKNEVIQCEAVSASHPDTGNVDYLNTAAIYAGRFAQILTKEFMEKLLEFWGGFLKLPGRAIWLVHPLPEDNDHVTFWKYRDTRLQFPKVEWGDTTPYSIAELRRPLERGLGGPVEIFCAQKIPYYHQKYSALVVRAAARPKR